MAIKKKKNTTATPTKKSKTITLVKKHTPAIPAKPDTPKKRPVTFQIHADPGSTVCIAGAFNNWDAKANVLSDPDATGNFSIVLSLPPGSHEYKFVIDGTWCVDPNCPDWVQNSLGTLNSVRKV